MKLPPWNCQLQNIAVILMKQFLNCGPLRPCPWSEFHQKTILTFVFMSSSYKLSFILIAQSSFKSSFTTFILLWWAVALTWPGSQQRKLNLCFYMFNLHNRFRLETSFLPQVIVQIPFFYYGQLWPWIWLEWQTSVFIFSTYIPYFSLTKVIVRKPLMYCVQWWLWHW